MTVWALMTAMPPTKGHEALINFVKWSAESLNTEGRIVINTQPEEPYSYARAHSVSEMSGYMRTFHIHETLPQSPEDFENFPELAEQYGNFWGMWDDLLRTRGFRNGDYVVASEKYGLTLATMLGGKFLPFDMDRQIRFTKATNIRENMVDYWDDIADNFKQHLTTTVTLFGAESCGKTTTGQKLAQRFPKQYTYVPEWARDYLEVVGPELSRSAMETIGHGQEALQVSVDRLQDRRPVIVQDTDLFSTIGYWNLHLEDYGPMPSWLEYAALRNSSYLYIVLSSDIPFKEDMLRYGGDQRESDDSYWISLLERYDLPYVVVTEQDYRVDAVHDIINQVMPENIKYKRRYNG